MLWPGSAAAAARIELMAARTMWGSDLFVLARSAAPSALGHEWTFTEAAGPLRYRSTPLRPDEAKDLPGGITQTWRVTIAASTSVSARDRVRMAGTDYEVITVSQDVEQGSQVMYLIVGVAGG